MSDGIRADETGEGAVLLVLDQALVHVLAQGVDTAGHVDHDLLGQECLALVHWKDLVWENGTVEDTQYSNVYDQSAGTLALRNWNDYDTTVHFSL